MGLTVAKYVIQPFFPNCPLPEAGVAMVAAATICKLNGLLIIIIQYYITFNLK